MLRIEMPWKGMDLTIEFQIPKSSEIQRIRALNLLDATSASHAELNLLASSILRVSSPIGEVEGDWTSEADGFGPLFLTALSIRYYEVLHQAFQKIEPELQRWSRWSASEACCYGWDDAKRAARGCGTTCTYRGSSCPGLDAGKLLVVWDFEKSDAAGRIELDEWQALLVNTYRAAYFDEKTRKQREAEDTRKLREQFRPTRKR